MRYLRVILMAAVSMAAATAHADQRCKSVDFTFENQIDSMIRIQKLYYFDIEDDKNRSKNIWNRTIRSDRQVGPYNITLPYVGAEAIARFFVQYQECQAQSGNNCSSWGPKRNSRGYIPNPAVTYCAKNMDVHVIVTEVGQLPS